MKVATPKEYVIDELDHQIKTVDLIIEILSMNNAALLRLRAMIEQQVEELTHGSRSES